MKRRFRQKQDQAPPEDPDKELATSGDDALYNVDIDDIIEEIDTLCEGEKDKPKTK
jgi:hypothetical protein